MKLWPEWYTPGRGKPPVVDVVDYVAKRMKLTPSDIRTGNQCRHYVNARGILCIVLRERGLSSPVVGRLLGYSDHSCVIHHCQTFPHRVVRSPELTTLLNDTRMFASGGRA